MSHIDMAYSAGLFINFQSHTCATGFLFFLVIQENMNRSKSHNIMSIQKYIKEGDIQKFYKVFILEIYTSNFVKYIVNF